MTVLDYRNKVSIAVIAFYVPILFISLFLIFSKGIHRNGGFVYIIFFALMRIIGGAMQVATASDTTNKSLYYGYAILVSIGLSPLMLSTLGMQGRVLSGIERTKKLAISEMILYILHLLIIVALILSIIGITQLQNGAIFSGHYKQPGESIASVALFIASFVAILFVTIYLAFNMSAAPADEKRLMYGIILSMPFVLVRLIYSSVSVLGNYRSFNPFTGNVTIFLCMALLMEFIVVVIYEAIGFTLSPFPTDQPAAAGKPQSPTSDEELAGGNSNAPHPNEKSNGGVTSTLKKIGRYTIIGNIIMAVQNRKK